MHSISGATVSSEAQRALAKRLATTLTASGYSVPGIEIVEVPPERTQVRFFHAADKPLAEDVVRRLGEFGLKEVQLEPVGGDQDRAPQKQFEVWLGALQRPN